MLEWARFRGRRLKMTYFGEDDNGAEPDDFDPDYDDTWLADEDDDDSEYDPED